MYKVRLLAPLVLDENDLKLVVALSIRPGVARSEHELGTILWGRQWENDPSPERLRSPITRARLHIEIPNKQRNISAYRANLTTADVDLSDFIERSKAETLDTQEVDYLLGLWDHDPQTAFNFLAASEFNPAARARQTLIARITDWTDTQLAGLKNLDRFRALFETECESIAVPMPRRMKRLLIVDDNKGLTGMLTGLLGGFETVIADSAQEAIAIISDASARIDGALVDLHLTDRGNDNQGIVVLDTLRFQRPTVPRVLMTSSPPPEAITKFTESYGLFELLVKNGPDAPAHTRRTIEEMLSDSPHHSIERTRTTLRTLSGRAQQFATQSVIAATRREKLGETQGENLTAALERLEAIDTAASETLAALDGTGSPQEAEALVEAFGLRFADCLTAEESAS